LLLRREREWSSTEEENVEDIVVKDVEDDVEVEDEAEDEERDNSTVSPLIAARSGTQTPAGGKENTSTLKSPYADGAVELSGILFRGLHLSVLLSQFIWRTYLVKLFGGN
jgi:hypothetical protein